MCLRFWMNDWVTCMVIALGAICLLLCVDLVGVR